MPFDLGVLVEIAIAHHDGAAVRKCTHDTGSDPDSDSDFGSGFDCVAWQWREVVTRQVAAVVGLGNVQKFVPLQSGVGVGADGCTLAHYDVVDRRVVERTAVG